MWSDGSLWTGFEPWDAGQPDNAGGIEHFLGINHQGNLELWNDFQESIQLPRICQFDPFDP